MLGSTLHLCAKILRLFHFHLIFSNGLLTFLLLFHGASYINQKIGLNNTHYTPPSPLAMSVFMSSKMDRSLLSSFLMIFCALFPFQHEIVISEYTQSQVHSSCPAIAFHSRPSTHNDDNNSDNSALVIGLNDRNSVA